jgi:hypothetical protein
VGRDFRLFQIVFSHTTDRPREAYGVRQSGRAAWELAPCGEVLGTPLSLVGQMVEICDQAESRVSLNHTGRKVPSAILGIKVPAQRADMNVAGWEIG